MSSNCELFKSTMRTVFDVSVRVLFDLLQDLSLQCAYAKTLALIGTPLHSLLGFSSHPLRVVGAISQQDPKI
jgi:hypothetical protein